MAEYTPWTTVDISAGEATKEEIFQLTKGNQEYFNQRIDELSDTSKIDIFDVKYGGFVNQYSEAELDAATPTFKAPVTGEIVSFVVTLLEASTSGNLQIKLYRSTNNGVSWDALVNNATTVSGSTVGSISGAVDWIDPVESPKFDQNDLLKIEVFGIQVNQGAFHVSIYGEI